MSTTPETLYEQTLVIRSQLGDEAAFEGLLELHGPRLLLFAQRMMQSSPESVADVTQEIWVAIYRALPRLLDASKFRPWAFRIARATGSSVGTVRSRIHYGKEALKKAWKGKTT